MSEAWWFISGVALGAAVTLGWVYRWLAKGAERYGNEVE